MIEKHAEKEEPLSEDEEIIFVNLNDEIEKDEKKKSILV